MRANVVERYGCVELDTISAVSRSKMVERFIRAVLSPHDGHVREPLPMWLQFPQR